jgi:hypothetical protein
LAASLSQEVRTPSLEMLQQKLFYALGAFLRGNPFAQSQFAKHKGPALLAGSIDLWANGYKSSHYVKMTQRVLSLASDVLLEVQQERQQQEENTNAKDLDQVVFHAFADSSWCQAILRAFEGPRSLQRAALHSVQSFEGHYQWESTTIQKVMQKLKGEWEKDEDIDAEAFEDQFAVMEQYVVSLLLEESQPQPRQYQG